MRRVGAVALLAALAAASALAQEQSPPGTRVGATVAALSGEDDAKRSAAIDVLARPDPDALPPIVEAASRSDDDRLWSGLATALGRWPAEAGADALSRLRASWPAAARRRLDLLVTRLRADAQAAPFPEIGESPPAIAERVRTLLAPLDGATRYSWPSPAATQITELGHDAVPALAAVLRDRASRAREFDPLAWTAADALAALAEPGDAPIVAALVRRGSDPAAKALGALPAAAASDAIAAAFESDHVGRRLLDEFAQRSDDRRASLALVGWLERHASDAAAGEIATQLAAARCDDAVPAIRVALAAKPSARTRVELATALADLGGRDGIDALVDSFEAHGDFQARASAGIALARISGHAWFHAGRDGDPGPPESGFDEAAAKFRSWWNDTGSRARFDPALRRWSDDGDDDELASSPAEVAREVRAVLAEFTDSRSYGSPNPQVDRLVELGHDAVPELLRAIREVGASHENWPRACAAAEAVAQLATDADVPAIAVLLAGGARYAPPCLDRIHSPAARDALLGAVRNGHFGYEVVQALSPYASDAAVQEAVIAWLARRHGFDGGIVGHAARLLADGGATQAIPALEAVTASPISSDSRADVGAALAGLGDPQGIEILLALLADPASSGVARVRAGKALDRISRLHVFRGTESPFGTDDNAAEALTAFRAWWDGSKAKIRFDAPSRRWTTESPGAGFAWPVPSPEMDAKVREILDAMHDRSGYFGKSGEGRALVALGHDAVPAIAAYIHSLPPDADAPGKPHRAHAAAEALAELRTDADAPLVAALLAEGHPEVARAAIGLRVPCIRDAVLAAARRGAGGSDLVASLADWRDEPETWEAVGAALRRGEADYFLLGFLAHEGTQACLPVARSLADSGTPPRVQAHALCAMVRNGDRSAVPPLIEFVAHDPGNAIGPNSWSTSSVGDDAGRVLNSIVGERIHPAPDAAQRFAAWWSENGDGLRFDDVRRVWTTAAPDGTKAVAADPASPIASRIADLFSEARRSRVYSTLHDDVTDGLVAIGRAAVPYLVREVRDGLPWTDDRSEGDVRARSADALCSLLTESDDELALAILREGRLGLAGWVEKHPSPAGADALCDVLRRGFLPYEVSNALLDCVADPASHAAVVAWVKRFRGTSAEADWTVGDLLAKAAPDGTRPGVRDLADASLPDGVRASLAIALCGHGVREAIPALIDFYAAPRGLTKQADWRVADALNGAAGRRIADAPEDMPIEVHGLPPRLRSGDESIATSPARDATVAALRAWWKESAERLRFDAAAEKWVLDPPAEK